MLEFILEPLESLGGLTEFFFLFVFFLLINSKGYEHSAISSLIFKVLFINILFTAMKQAWGMCIKIQHQIFYILLFYSNI